MDVSNLDQSVEDAKVISLPVHVSPDLDTTCAVLVMHRYLTRKFPDKKFQMLSEGPLPALAAIQDLTTEFIIEDDITPFINSSDLVIYIDANQYRRFSVHYEKIDTKIKSICIDHHPTDPEKFTITHIDTTAIAATQLLVEILYDQDLPEERDVELLLIGIMSDSGNLMYITERTSKVLDIIKRLLEGYAHELSSIAAKILSIDKSESLLIADLLRNMRQVKIKNYPPINYTYLLNEQVEPFDNAKITEAYHKFIDTYLKSFEDTSWGFVLVPKKPDQLSISFRSAPGHPNVDELATKLGGGGHKKAAGTKRQRFDIREDSDQACLRVLNTIEEMELEVD